MKIALVHDWILSMGGAERVLQRLHGLFPDAPIYTLAADKRLTRKFFPGAEIRTSVLGRLPLPKSWWPALAIAMPPAIESLDLSAFGTVISSSAVFSKGIVLRPTTRHICYCYSPTRWLWDRSHRYERSGVLSLITRNALRLWDRAAAGRVTDFVAISETVRERISRYYGRESVVIYPPAPYFSDGAATVTDAGYYLVVGRLVPHKNLEPLLTAFSKLRERLVVVGDGPLMPRLLRYASHNVTFTGWVGDARMKALYTGARAVIVPSEEDFGLTAVESMSYGKPVIALRDGGAGETVAEGVTGVLVDDPIPEAFADGIRRFNDALSSFDAETIRTHAKRYAPENFDRAMLELLNA